MSVSGGLAAGKDAIVIFKNLKMLSLADPGLASVC